MQQCQFKFLIRNALFSDPEQTALSNAVIMEKINSVFETQSHVFNIQNYNLELKLKKVSPKRYVGYTHSSEFYSNYIYHIMSEVLLDPRILPRLVSIYSAHISADIPFDIMLQANLTSLVSVVALLENIIIIYF